MNAQQLLAVSVTPVVLISACGLITAALYNRLSAILARIRAYHQHKLETLEDRNPHRTSQHSLLLHMLDSQIAKMTAKAKMIQKGLFCLLSAILAFLLCSLLTAVAVLHDSIGVVALVAHMVGLALFAAGIGWALKELARSLGPLEEEGLFLQSLTRQHHAAAGDDQEFSRAA